MSDYVTPARAGYLTDEQMAEERGKTVRAQRAERQQRRGPPWVRDGNKVLYPVALYRAWLEANTRQPICAKRARAVAAE